MLIRFSVENYRSIREGVVLDLIPKNSIKDFEGNTIATGISEAPSLLRLVSIYGYNASGKSNILRALDTMRAIILGSAKQNSLGDKIIVEPFLLDEKSFANPTTFTVEFIASSTRYIYKFSATVDHVLFESLYAYPQGVKQIWFERIHNVSAEESSWKFGSHFKGDKFHTKERTLNNQLFLSKAIMDNVEQLIPIDEFFREKLFISPNNNRNNTKYNTSKFMETEEGRNAVLTFLRGAGLDIDDISHRKREVAVQDFPEEIRKQFTEKTITTYETKAVHIIPGTNEVVEFDFNRHESTGTNKMFQLAGVIITALENGGTLLIDELERSLHPKLLASIIDLFNHPKTNRNDAQLIFSTHAPMALDIDHLRRDQIWFTDKLKEKNTILYSLADVAKYVPGAKPVRKGQDISKAFLEGRFYSPPRIDVRQLSLFEE